MCLTVPCEVIHVDGETTLVARGAARFEVSLLFLDEAVRPGDWVAVQAIASPMDVYKSQDQAQAAARLALARVRTSPQAPSAHRRPAGPAVVSRRTLFSFAVRPRTATATAATAAAHGPSE